MARPKKVITKDKVIRLRLTDAELQKVRAYGAGKTLSESVRSLVLKGVEIEKNDMTKWNELVNRIEQAELSKISEKLDIVLQTLGALGSAGKGEDDTERLLKFLRRILGESAKARIEIEEYARRNMPAMPHQLFEQDVKVRFEKFREEFKKGGD